MHFFRSSAVLLALGLSSSIAAPTSAGLSSRNTGGRPDPNIQFVSTWGDIGWRRYRFQWKNIAPRSCDAYVNAIQGAGGITHNWQCWDGGDGWWYFDDSEVAGPVGSGIILTGINHVEGNDADGLCDTYNWGKGDGGNGADGCPIWD